MFQHSEQSKPLGIQSADEYARQLFAVASPALQYKITSAIISELREWYMQSVEHLSPCVLAESSSALGPKVRLSVKDCEGQKYLLMGYSIDASKSYIEIAIAPQSSSFQEHSLANTMGMLLLNGVQFAAPSICSFTLNKLRRIFAAYEQLPASHGNTVLQLPEVSKSEVRSWGQAVSLFQPKASLISTANLEQLPEILKEFTGGVFLKPNTEAFKGKRVFFMRPVTGSDAWHVKSEDLVLADYLERKFSEFSLPNFDNSEAEKKGWYSLNFKALEGLLRELVAVDSFLIEEQFNFVPYQNFRTGLSADNRYKGELRFIYCWDNEHHTFSLQAGCTYETASTSLQKYSKLVGHSSMQEVLQNVCVAARQLGLQCPDEATLLTQLFQRVDACAAEFIRRTEVPGGKSAAPIAIDVAPIINGDSVDFALVEINQASKRLPIGAKKISGPAAMRLIFSEWKPYFCLPEISSLMDHDF